MKRLVLLIAALFIAGNAFAAGTATVGTWQIENGKCWSVLVTWTDDTSGTTTTITCPRLNSSASWYVTLAEIDPGATAPTALYDITLTKANSDSNSPQGVDCFQGGLLNLSATATEVKTPLSAFVPVTTGEVLTFTLSNNAVNNATGTVKIYVEQ